MIIDSGVTAMSASEFYERAGAAAKKTSMFLHMIILKRVIFVKFV